MPVKKQEPVIRLPRWTEVEETALIQAVDNEKSASKAFEKIARETNRSKGTVQAKYYQMRKKSNVAPTKKKSANTYAQRAPINLQKLTLEQLISVAEGIHAEIEIRREQLASQMERLNQVRP